MQVLTPRLLLDDLRPDDAEALFACRGDPAVARYQGWQPTRPEEAADFIARQADVAFGFAGAWCQLAIRRRDDGRMIGDLGVHFPVAHGDAVELGISLQPAWQGRGYAREAVGAMLDLLFGSMDCRRATVSIDPRNRPSIALFESLGFRRGTLPAQDPSARSAWPDDLLLALPRQAWTGTAPD